VAAGCFLITMLDPLHDLQSPLWGQFRTQGESGLQEEQGLGEGQFRSFF